MLMNAAEHYYFNQKKPGPGATLMRKQKLWELLSQHAMLVLRVQRLREWGECGAGGYYE